MNNFCTYFNINYLAKALVMIESLKKSQKNFKLYVLAFDDQTIHFLKQKKIKEIVLLDLKKFEDKELLKAKKNRTNVEYFWTCTPSLILFVLKNYKVNSCTYIDADLCFYNGVKSILKKRKNKSVYITDHYYSQEYDQKKKSGQFNVQFITCFRNQNAIKLMKIWRKQCLKWCFNYFENGKFGDQKYLDQWKKLNFVHIYKERGCGLAPWNLQQYDLKNKNYFFYKKFEKIFFFHFHGLNKIFRNFYFISSYKINQKFKNIIYYPYIKRLNFYENHIENFLKKNNYKSYLKLNLNIKYLFKIFTNLKNILRTN